MAERPAPKLLTDQDLPFTTLVPGLELARSITHAGTTQLGGGYMRFTTDAEFADWTRPSLLPMTRLAKRLAPHADADDIVQEALARACKLDPRSPGSFETQGVRETMKAIADTASSSHSPTGMICIMPGLSAWRNRSPNRC